ncbi:MFS general substrate transporter, partial [Lophium mytilinum]
FEVSFTGDTDPRSAKSLPIWRKWLIVFTVSGASLLVATTSSLYVATYAQIEKEFGISNIVATLGLTLFVAGCGLGPMLLGPLSEFYGRKPIYIVSLAFFAIWIIPCAVAQNIQTLLVARFLGGLCGSAFLSVAGSTMGDLFARDQLQKPMMVYTITPFLGPELGPIVGGFINYNVNWRWSFWVLLIWAGFQWAAMTFLVPETYHPVLLRKEARRLRKETGDERWYAPIEKMDRSIPHTIMRSCYRPFMLLLLEPMCLLLCTLTAFLLGLIYLFFGAFSLVFRENHGFNLWQIGLTFIGMIVGMLLACLADPWWHKNHQKLIAKHVAETGNIGGSEPEFRLPPAILGAPMVFVGLLWFGWTTYASVHWIVPIIGSSLISAGIFMVFSGVFTFLVECYPLYAASALAANSFERSMFAAGFPLFGPAMYHNLGFQWATFLLAMIMLVLAPFPYIFFRYGKQIRAKSRYSGAK